MFLDLLMDWEDAANIVKATGFDGWIAHVADKFPRYGLSCTSTDWFDIGSEYIAKLRGTFGDVIVGWKN